MPDVRGRWLRRGAGRRRSRWPARAWRARGSRRLPAGPGRGGWLSRSRTGTGSAGARRRGWRPPAVRRRAALFGLRCSSCMPRSTSTASREARMLPFQSPLSRRCRASVRSRITVRWSSVAVPSGSLTTRVTAAACCQGVRTWRAHVSAGMSSCSCPVCRIGLCGLAFGRWTPSGLGYSPGTDSPWLRSTTSGVTERARFPPSRTRSRCSTSACVRRQRANSLVLYGVSSSRQARSRAG